MELSLVGIGTGNPDHLTLQAIAALNAADLILLPLKEGKEDLAQARRALIARAVANPAVTIAGFDMPVRDDRVPDYRNRVDLWHDAIAARWTEAIARHPGAAKVALLVWGDPSLYDSTLRIAGRLSPAPRITVIPGITALQALCAAHAIPLNDLAAPVVVTTGRLLREGGWPAGATRVAVMLDAGGAFGHVPPEGVTIWWGANLGLPSEALVTGPLAEAGPRITATRESVRARHGWVMDIYLMARAAGEQALSAGCSPCP
ncbi:MAG: precorrin-6A synthase (deacetylating) [Rubellimicrobium sp.]|nr:precorrin-6A synthase (deacetylating) [Rubellimicrobium sp.]